MESEAIEEKGSQRKLDDLETENKRLRQREEALKKELDECKNFKTAAVIQHKIYAADEEKKNKEIKVLKGDLQKAESALMNLGEQNMKIVEKLGQLEYKYESVTGNAKKTREYILVLEDGHRKAVAALQQQIDASNNTMKSLQAKESIIEQEKFELWNEKQELLLRLSRVAGANLTYNNPNITDLSDPHRPTKLAGEFSELYDNEWTEAFGELRNKDETENIKTLLLILKRAFAMTHGASSRQFDAIKQSLTVTIQSYQKPLFYREDGLVEKRNTHGRLEEHGDEINAGATAANDDIGDFVIKKHDSSPMVESNNNTNLWNRDKITDCSLPVQKQAPVQHLQGYQIDTPTDPSATRPTEREPSKWSGMPRIETVSYDFDKLSIAQKQSLVDVRNQVKQDLEHDVVKVMSNFIVEEMELGDNAAVYAYVDKCCKLSWETSNHNPPVYIEFVEVTKETAFDKGVYKHYTISGPLLDYVVWPPMYLYQGGPMLSKGVAQGR